MSDKRVTLKVTESEQPPFHREETKNGDQYQWKGVKMNVTREVMLRENEMNREERRIQKNKIRINDDAVQWIKVCRV